MLPEDTYRSSKAIPFPETLLDPLRQCFFSVFFTQINYVVSSSYDHSHHDLNSIFHFLSSKRETYAFYNTYPSIP